jgi:dsRNA-specific ribonuclease
MEVYSQVFTHPSANDELNYEAFELAGDVTLNKAIVWYFLRRFPQLNCPKGVKVVTRLKIRYVSKKAFSNFAKDLGFWYFISASDDVRAKEMKPALEDVFEAFTGATEYLIDKKIGLSVGYSVCYNIVKELFDQVKISLKYEDLYDAITRLKETQDYWNSMEGREKWKKIDPKQAFGRLVYENERVIDTNTRFSIQYVTIYRISDKREKKVMGNVTTEIKTTTKLAVLAKASAALLPDAKQKAALIALENLKQYGMRKPKDPYYYNLDK